MVHYAKLEGSASVRFHRPKILTDAFVKKCPSGITPIRLEVCGADCSSDEVHRLHKIGLCVQSVLGTKVLKQRGYQHENTCSCGGDWLTGIPHEQEIPAPVTTTTLLLFVTASDKFKSALLTDVSLAPASNGSARGMMGGQWCDGWDRRRR